MKIAIDFIKVDEAVRIRQEIGNLKPLEESIAKVGLINPILIDEQSRLVAGYRRLEACKNLGLKEVDVKIIELGGNQLKMLDLEAAENFFRKDFTPDEILATERRRQEIIEASREKGVFERFWCWLKGLFGPKAPVEDGKPASSHNVSGPMPGSENKPSGNSGEPPAKSEVVEDPAHLDNGPDEPREHEKSTKDQSPGDIGNPPVEEGVEDDLAHQEDTPDDTGEHDDSAEDKALPDETVKGVNKTDTFVGFKDDRSIKWRTS